MFKKVKAPKVTKIKLNKGGEKYDYFRVTWYDREGKRQAKQFNNRPEATLFASETHTAILNDGASRKVLSTVLTESVLRQCEAAVEKLGGRYDLDAVVRYFLDHHCDPSIKVLMSAAIGRFLASQEAILSEANLKAYKQTLNRFVEATGDVHVHEVTHETIETFLHSLRGRDGVNAASGKTWENTRKNLNRFFNWCAERPQLYITHNPAADVSRKDDKPLHEIHSLSSAEVEKLMRHLEARFPQLIPYFSICIFAGVRSNGEMERLSKKTNAIRLDNDRIIIGADVAKVRGEVRHVTIQPNLRAWLTKYQGPIFPENVEKDITAIRKEFGLDDRKYQNVMRHTFISCHAQAFGSFVETATQSGNSETVIRDRYYNTLTTKEDALRFWSIVPA
jgi:integrase